MQKSQKGFTLIELVVVIVLLGILGVTALAKFQDLSDEAQNAANSGVAGELSAGSAINYAAVITGAGGTAINGTAEVCTGMGPLFATGVLPTGYTYVGGGNCTTAASFACTINSTVPSTVAGTGTVICTP